MPQNDDSRPTTPPPSTPATSYSVQKADQIASRFFIKFLLIVVSSRSTVIEYGPRSAKVDKWFNLETPDTDIHRDHMRTFRSLSAMSTLPSLTLHTVLTIPDLGTNRVLVALDSVGSRLRIEPTPRAILLETWTLTATQPSGPSSSLSSSESGEVSLAAVYKHAISLFRSLYTLVRLLPAAKLYQRYKPRAGTLLETNDFGIEIRLQLDPSVLGFDASPSPSRPAPMQTSTHAFPAMYTPLGSLKIAVRYLSRPGFRIDTLESLISSRLFNQDAGQALDESVAFTPTVLAHRARESAASSPGSAGAGLAIRNAKPPLSSTRHLRTISFPAVSGEISSPVVHERGESGSGSTSDVVGPTMGNSPRYTQGRPEPLTFATPGSLGRAGQLHSARESLDMQRPTERASPGTSTSPPSNVARTQPGASPRADGTRRPSVTPISAFKSSTFGSSGLNSPSTSLRSLGLGTPGVSRPPSSLPHAIPEAPGGTSSRPWPTIASSPPSSGLAQPTSEPPPFATSSSVPRSAGLPLLGTGGSPRSGESASSGIITKPAGSKRYSSTFGHRRAPSTGTPGGASSNEASTRGLGGRMTGSPAALLSDLPPEKSRPSSTLLEPTEDEQDLSEFIRALDAKPRLAATSGQNDSNSSSSASSSAIGHARRVSLADRRQSPLIGRLELAPPSPRSPPSRLRELHLIDRPEAEVTTSPGDVAKQSQPQRGLDEKLQTMDDEFKKSFQGLMQRRQGMARRAGDANPPAEEPAQLPDESGPGVRRPGLSFRSGNAIRGRPNPATSAETEPFATPPGDSTASDGSGYAGIVGQLDLDSPEGQLPTSPFGARPRPSSTQATRLSGAATTTTTTNTPARSSDSSTGTSMTTGTTSRARQRGLEDEVAEGRYEGDNESTSRGPRYTPVLRRDATLRPQDRHSSGSSSNNADGGDSSRTRRPATGWAGSTSPPS